MAFLYHISLIILYIMSVINCKVKYIRPQYQNLKEWMEDPNNIYIGRAGVVFIDKERFPKQSSPFHNPFKIGKDGNRNDVIEKYRKYIIQKLDSEPELKLMLLDMKGKNLGCWCMPEACHGDVLLDIINSI